MKKLITIILILAMLLPAAALAEQDPIVGYWYVFYDGAVYPEFLTSFGDYDSALALYYFSDNGSIILLENNMKDGAATPTFSSCGKWEKELFSYKFSILGIGNGTIELKTDTMEMAPSNYNGVKMVFHNIIRFNPYQDFKY